MIILIVFSAIIGLIVGSFLNCLAWRLYEDESIMGRSHCRSCRKLIAWYDNIPVLSFLLLGGRCRQCHKAISWQYPIVEAVVGLLFVVAAIYSPADSFILARNWFVLAVFVLIFIMDARWYVILDKVSLPAAAIVVILNILAGYSWQNLLLSATIGTGFFLIQYAVSRGKALGGGDVRLGLLLGVALGWPNILAAIFLGYGIGAVSSVALLIFKKKNWKSIVPLGTFLTVGGVITLLFGDLIVSWYLQIIHIQ